MKTFEYKRALLYRKAQGNVHKVDYFNKIHLLTGCIVDQEQLLTLEETDGIIQSLKKKKNYLKKTLQTNDYQQIISFIEEKTGDLIFHLLIDEDWKFCGAYRTNKILLDNYNFDILKSDEIRIISHDLSFQIRIDYDNNEITLEYTAFR